MYEARAIFTLKSRFKYQFDKAMELDGARLETKDGRICGEVVVQVRKSGPDLIAEKAFEKANKVAFTTHAALRRGLCRRGRALPYRRRRKGGKRRGNSDLRIRESGSLH